jgi:glucosamine--fructose-6-phosphate aminotransferase (isomerizing)
MCGIVGAVSRRNIVPILVQGLQRLEYRGYDSCGVAVHRASPGAQPAAARRSTARVAELLAQVQDAACRAPPALPTPAGPHGAPAVHNAHPHFSPGQRGARPAVALVHNGIIENHEELRAELQAGLCLCQPDRHRGHRPPGGQPVRRRPVRGRAGRHAELHGAYAIAVLHGRAAPRGGRARRLAADPGRGQDGPSTSWPATPWPWPA